MQKATGSSKDATVKANPAMTERLIPKHFREQFADALEKADNGWLAQYAREHEGEAGDDD